MNDEAHSDRPLDRRRALVTAATLALVFAVCAFTLERLPREVRQGQLAVASLERDPSVEAIFLGSSHVFENVDPGAAVLPWMNLAAGMADFAGMEGVLAAHVDRLPALRAVVLEADAIMATVNSLERYDGDYRPILDLAPEVFAIDATPGQRFGLVKEQAFAYRLPFGRVFARDKLDAPLLLDVLRGREEEKGVVLRPGYLGHAGSTLAAMDGHRRIEGHLLASPNPEAALQRNLPALERMLRTSHERGLHVVLARLPHHPVYVEHRPEVFVRAYDRILETARVTLPEGAYSVLDFESDPVIGAHEWYDADHLNLAGTARFTPILSEALRSALPARSPARTRPGPR